MKWIKLTTRKSRLKVVKGQKGRLTKIIKVNRGMDGGEYSGYADLWKMSSLLRLNNFIIFWRYRVYVLFQILITHSPLILIAIKTVTIKFNH